MYLDPSHQALSLTYGICLQGQQICASIMDLAGDALWPDLKDDEVEPLQGSATSLSLPSDWVHDGELALSPEDAIECAANLGSSEVSSPEPCLRPLKR